MPLSSTVATISLSHHYDFTPGEIEHARQWESDIADYEYEDQKRGVVPGGVLFLGSSTIRMWDNVAHDFRDVLPDIAILNRGFGGSHVSDSLFHIKRVLLPHAPRAVVFFAGDNDLAAGKAAERVFAGTVALCERTWEQLPETRFLLISVKPSPSRRNLWNEQVKANGLMREFCRSDERLTFIDIVPPMFDEKGRLRRELYVEDELHLSSSGYRLWREVLEPYLAVIA